MILESFFFSVALDEYKTIDYAMTLNMSNVEGNYEITLGHIHRGECGDSDYETVIGVLAHFQIEQTELTFCACSVSNEEFLITIDNGTSAINIRCNEFSMTN